MAWSGAAAVSSTCGRNQLHRASRDAFRSDRSDHQDEVGLVEKGEQDPVPAGESPARTERKRVRFIDQALALVGCDHGGLDLLRQKADGLSGSLSGGFEAGEDDRSAGRVQASGKACDNPVVRRPRGDGRSAARRCEGLDRPLPLRRREVEMHRSHRFGPCDGECPRNRGSGALRLDFEARLDDRSRGERRGLSPDGCSAPASSDRQPPRVRPAERVPAGRPQCR